MSPLLILSCIAAYFGFLLLIAWYTSRQATNETYFLGNKASPWYAVAFGMIGDSLSGVTFISVPGAVGLAKFSYLQLVFGYFFGYWVISELLLPLYYRLNLTSIYSYLGSRLGTTAQKTGAFYFILSRTLGAAGRLFLAAGVIQIFVFDNYGVPFGVSVSVIIALMLLYTYKGGIKTLVWTDTFQSTFLLLGVILSIVAISGELNLSFDGMIDTVSQSDLSQVFFWDPIPKSFFLKQFIGGMFIAIVMTGLDQNMMQKNLSCNTLGEAQKNIRWFSLVVVIVNLFFLSLGVLLYQYANNKGLAIPGKTDDLFPTLALQHLGAFAGLVFIVGLTAATFSSADSVLTTLTTSFYIDFMNADNNPNLNEQKRKQLRTRIHIGFAVLLWLVILIFRWMNNAAIIDTILVLAGYTYGPLLGLFAFGLLTNYRVNDKRSIIPCLLAPIVCYLLNSIELPYGYKIGHELLIINGTLTFIGLWLLKGEKMPVETTSDLRKLVADGR